MNIYATTLLSTSSPRLGKKVQIARRGKPAHTCMRGNIKWLQWGKWPCLIDMIFRYLLFLLNETEESGVSWGYSSASKRDVQYNSSLPPFLNWDCKYEESLENKRESSKFNGTIMRISQKTITIGKMSKYNYYPATEQVH